MLANAPVDTVRAKALELFPRYITQQYWYTSTGMLRKIAEAFGVNINAHKRHKFKGWESLPNKAILSINPTKDKKEWHWVIFMRTDEKAFVIDPWKNVIANRRIDFGRMKVNGYLPVT